MNCSGNVSLRRLFSLLPPLAMAGLLVSCASRAASPVPTPTPADPTARPVATVEATVGVTAELPPTTESACRPEAGILRHSSYMSGSLEREVALDFYVPPCYESEGGLFPTLYFFHGHPFDETHWPSLGLLDLYALGLEDGRWRSALLVFPQLPEPLFTGSDGGPGSYEEEFLEAVLPAVDAQFGLAGTSPRSLAGISRGGIWALEIGFRHPHQFEAVAALSPSLSVNYARATYDPMVMAAADRTLPDRVLLAAGEGDWARPMTEELAQELEGGADIEYLQVPGNHSDDTWAGALPQVLDFLLGTDE